jgi:hypothetical protein
MVVKVSKADSLSEIDFSNTEAILDDWKSPFISDIDISTSTC